MNASKGEEDLELLNPLGLSVSIILHGFGNLLTCLKVRLSGMV
jgi:hypothetical protein